MIFEVIICIFAPLLVYLTLDYIRHLHRCNNLPPGPFPLPIIGNLHLIGREPHKSLGALSRIYGNLFSFSFGSDRHVIIADYDSAKEAMVTQGISFAGRAKSPAAELITRGYTDIVMADHTPRWKEIRKCVHTALKTYHDNNLEDHVTEEIRACKERLIAYGGDEIDPETDIGLETLNAMSMMMFGRRYDAYDNKEFQLLTKIRKVTVENLANTAILVFLPWLKHFRLPAMSRLKRVLTLRDKFYTEMLLQHKETFDKSPIHDLTYSFIKMARERWQGSMLNSELEMIINDLLMASSDTTISQKLYFLRYMLEYPDAQQKIYDEISRFCAEERTSYPSLKRQNAFHFTRAAICESLRLSAVVLLGVPHKTMRDTHVGGYRIPADTTVMFNHWQIHHDDKYWPNPAHFSPERWLDKAGHFGKAHRKGYLPFGLGVRVCLGQQAAESNLFLFVTRIIKDFQLTAKHLPPLNDIIGIGKRPAPFTMAFVPRQ